MFTTSAQNHPLPLNGNKYIASFILLLILSCIVWESFAQDGPGRKRKFGQVEEEFVLPAIRTDLDTVLKQDTTVVMDAEVFRAPKTTLNISLLLPFFSDSITVEGDTGVSGYDILKSRMALDLYQGVKFALDSLTQQGYSFHLHVFDTKQSENKLQQILANPSLRHSDLIIGPVYNSLITPAAHFAKLHQIPLVSPLSPGEYLTDNNPFFYMANPGLEAHCKALVNFAKQQFYKDNIILISAAADKEMAPLFKQFLQSEYGSSITYKELLNNAGKYMDAKGQDPSLDLKSRLRSETTNVILVASIDMSLVHQLSRELFSLSKDYPIVVLGLPVWNPENDLRLDYMSKINVHFTQASYVTDTFFYNSAFAENFLETYKHLPNENNFKGFDIAWHFCNAILNHGNQTDAIAAYDVNPLNHTSFNFQAVYSKGSFEEPTVFLYYENQRLHLFKYKNDGLIRMR